MARIRVSVIINFDRQLLFPFANFGALWSRNVWSAKVVMLLYISIYEHGFTKRTLLCLSLKSKQRICTNKNRIMMIITKNVRVTV